MATRGIALTIQYVAWDTANNVGKTGDASNHTLRWVKDGTASAPTNSPSEVDATNCPGLYKLQLTSTETDCNIGTLAGKSSSSGVSIIPVTIQFERLPDAAPGASGGLPIIGSAPLTNLDAAVSSRASANDYTSARAEKLDNLDATVSSRLASNDSRLNNLDATISSRATVSGVWSHDNRSLTDKTNFSLVADYNAAKNAASQASVDALQTDVTAIKSKTQYLDFDDGKVKAKVFAYDTGMAPPTKDQIADQVWDEPIGQHQAEGSTGKALANAASGNVDYGLLADAVWDELLSGHQTEGSAGKALSQAAQGGGQSTVLIQPLASRVQTPEGDGGTVTFWTAATMRASWMVSQDLTGHNLVFLMYLESAPGNAVAECKGGEITITSQTYGSLIKLEASETKIPNPGQYRYVIRDQTVDSVLLVGECFVYRAPDVSP